MCSFFLFLSGWSLGLWVPFFLWSFWDLGAFWQRTFRDLVLGLLVLSFGVWASTSNGGACLVVTQVNSSSSCLLKPLQPLALASCICLFPPAIHAERNHPRFMRLDIEDLRDQINVNGKPRHHSSRHCYHKKRKWRRCQFDCAPMQQCSQDRGSLTALRSRPPAFQLR